ncbi:thermonuclease family protein [Chryseobacterium sp. CBSDS_008]|uniref:thermonuclease family protein n=1 Tax=Chryseobacterium sp. CBSDS_008 TaxID=3415265 RepID=UPI003CF208D3
MKRLMLLYVLFPVFLLSQMTGKVIKISDGDTLTLLLKGNQQKKLRLAEVDCPESGRVFGKNAKQFTSAQVMKNSMFCRKYNVC